MTAPAPPPWLPPGPYHTDPTAAAVEAAGALDGDDYADLLTDALTDVDLGDYDQRIVQWLARWGPEVLVPVLSWLHRLRAQSAAAARAACAAQLRGLIEEPYTATTVELARALLQITQLPETWDPTSGPTPARPDGPGGNGGPT